jgi:ABC-type taurine transport system substrate-binding protein
MFTQSQGDETVRYSKEEWEQHRPVIQGMYPLNGMNARGIVAFLKDRGFVVT